MKAITICRMLCLEAALCFFLAIPSLGQTRSSAPDTSATDSVCARALEVEGSVESKLSDEEARSLEPGDFVKVGQQLILSSESSVTLVIQDSTVRKFRGPAILAFTEVLPKTRGNILARLGSGIVALLFAREKESSEETMAPRTVEALEELEMRVPLLVHPAPGSSLLEKSTRFRWRKVAGVPVYRVSLYSPNRLLWQGTTSDFHIDCPSERCEFKCGKPYYWTVEAVIGESVLRSETAEFEILSEDARSEVYGVLQEVDSSITDENLCLSIKVRICLSLGIYDKALELINSSRDKESFDRRTYLLRAEIKEKMGLFEDAWLDYKAALRMPSEE